MQPIRNIQFTLLIRINKQLHEFNFRQRGPALFDTDSVDRSGERLFFKMILNEQNWMIDGQNLPEWITTHSTLIDEALQNKVNNL